MKKLSLLLVVFALGLGIASIAYADTGYEAGQKWAQENDITDVAYDENDPNNALAENESDSFDAGVRAYAEEQI